MNAYEMKQELKRERLEARAAKLRAEGESRIGRAREIASHIPFGQPILVGHHSEGRHRADLKRIRGGYERGYEALKAADAAEARADNIGQGGISSDDPDAPAKLRERIAELEARQAAMKADRANHAAYQLSNNSANIRRLKLRLSQVEKAATREHKEVSRPGGVRLVQNVEENRLQLIFPGKPAPDVIAKLKGHGFRWAPSVGAWQRQLNNAAIYAADQIFREG